MNRAEPVESGRDQRFLAIGPELIARNLFLEEAVVRFILLKRFHDVIAIAPRMRTVAIGLETVGIGITHDIEPLESPTLSVLRRAHQAIHQLFIRGRRSIPNEGFDFFGFRGKSGKIQRDPPDQLFPARGRRRFEAFRPERFEEKSIDRCFHPWTGNCGDLRMHRLLKRPITSPFGDPRFIGIGNVSGFRGAKQ